MAPTPKKAAAAKAVEKAVKKAPAAAAKATAAKKTAAAAAKAPAVKKAATAAKKTESTVAKTPAAKKTSTAAKKPAATKPADSVKLTAAGKKLLEAYRKASADEKKVAMKALNGEYGTAVTGLLNLAGDALSGIQLPSLPGPLGDILNGIL